MAEYNCYEPNYDPVTGWPLKLPDVEFGPNTLLLLHFQDFVTHSSQGIPELSKVEKHYRDRSNQVLVTHWPHELSRYYSGSVNLIEFNSHEYTILKNLKTRADEWQHFIIDHRTQAWQSLNGRKCNHRLRVATVLQSWSDGILSYADSIKLPSWPYSTYPGTENEDNFIRLAGIYGQCATNVITETQYDNAPGLITEKTLFAMLAEQVPIVIGYPGIVADCQDLGFDMFRDLVDTSYDGLPNDRRAEAALELNKKLILGQIDLSPYKRRLRSQRQFLLDYYPGLLETRFMIACESLARSWTGVL